MSRAFSYFAIALLLAPMFTNGQHERMPFGHESSYQITSKATNVGAESFNWKGDVVFEEDFEDLDNLNSEIWDIKRSTTIDGASLTNASVPMWFLCKPSSFNGNGATYIHSGKRSAAIGFSAKDFTWLITKNFIELPQDPSSLYFWLYFHKIPEQTIFTYFHVLIKESGKEQWEVLRTWDDTNESNQFQELIEVDLESYSNKNVQIAFVYENRNDSGFQVAIDNIIIGNLSTHDLRVSAYHFPYSMVPLHLIENFEVSINAYVQNVGLEYNDKSQAVKVSIPNLSNFSTRLSLTDTLETGDLSFYTLPDMPTFQSLGSYNVAYSIIPEDSDDDDGDDDNGDDDNGDDDNGDDDEGIKSTDSFIFNVTPKIYATDYCQTLGVNGSFSGGADVTFGNLYPINNGVLATGIEIEWPQFTQSTSFYGLVYLLNPVDSSLQIIHEQLYHKALEHSNSSVIYPIDTTYLTPEKTYFIAVRQINSNPLGVGIDRVRNGSFWRLNANNELEILSSPSIGNAAIRLAVSEPIAEPMLRFTILYDEMPVEDASIQIKGVDEELLTDESGFASIQLPNGYYTYSITKQSFATIQDTVRILYANVNKSFDLDREFEVVFSITDENEAPLENADIFVSTLSSTTDSDGEASLILTEGINFYTVTHSLYNPVQSSLVLFSDTTISVTLTDLAETISVDFELVNDYAEQPLQNVRVSLTNYGFKYTDNSGKVTFNGIVPTDSDLPYTFYRNGYETKSGVLPQALADTTILDTLVVKRYDVSVEVIDEEDDEPLSDSKVTLVSVTGSITQNTNEFGLTTFSDIVPEEEIELRVSKEGYENYKGSVTVDFYDIETLVKLVPVSNHATIDLAKQFKLYPNPTTGSFNISGDGEFSTFVFDLTGRLVYSNPNAFDSHTIDMSTKSSGIYIVKIISGEKVITERIIKQ